MFTYNEYIKPVLTELKVMDELYARLINYKKMNDITVKDTEHETFEEILRRMLKNK